MIRVWVYCLFIVLNRCIHSADHSYVIFDKTFCCTRVNELIQKASQRAEYMVHFMKLATAQEVESKLIVMQERSKNDLYLADRYLAQLEARLYASRRLSNHVEINKSSFSSNLSYADLQEIQDLRSKKSESVNRIKEVIDECYRTCIIPAMFACQHTRRKSDRSTRLPILKKK